MESRTAGHAADGDEAAVQTAARARTVYLVDGFDDGHHLTYLRNFAQQLMQMGHRVVELLPDPAGIAPWFLANVPESDVALRLHPYRHPMAYSPSWRLRRIVEPLKRWRAAAQAVRAAVRTTGWPPDLVFFNWLDDYLVGVSCLVPPVLPLVFPYRWAGIFVHPWHLRIQDGPTRADSVAAEGVLRSRNCTGVAVLDQGIVSALGANIRKPVILFPDATDAALPTVEPEVVGQLRAAAAGRRIIGLLGVLAKRKGVISLLQAARQAGDRPWCFAFLGVCDAGVRRSYNAEELALIDAAIAGGHDNVWFHPDRVEDECDFNAVVSACDVLFAGYELFAHSSGIVTKAGFFEKPVVVSPGYFMAEVVNEYHLGVVVDPHDTEALLAALDVALDSERLRSRHGTPEYDRFRREYAVEALRPAFAELLR